MAGELMGRGQGWGGMQGMLQRQLADIARDGRASLVASIAPIIELVRELADRLDGEGTAPAAGALRDVATLADDVRHRIETAEIDELLADGRRLVEQNPALAVGGAIALGFVVARVFKAARADGN